MRKAIAGACFGFLTLTVSISSAQVSTFPAPPPLPPPSSAQPAETPAPQVPSDAPTVPGNNNGTTPPVPVPDSAPTDKFANTMPVTAATLNSMGALDDKVPLRSGDRISFRVIEDKDDAVPRIVTDTGEVDFPYIGRLKVEGQTCRQVAIELKRLLEIDYYKRATVIVGIDVISPPVEAAPVHEMVWIVGQVRQVGPVEIIKGQPLTVSQAILRSGGFGDFADQRRIRLIHRKNSTAPSAFDTAQSAADAGDRGELIDVKSVFEGKSTVDPLVTPNDLIVVPKRLFNY